MVKPKGRKMTEEHKEALQKARDKKEAIQVIIEGDGWTIQSDPLCWSIDCKGRQTYFTTLQMACSFLLDQKLRRSEIRTLQDLKDAIDMAQRNIISAVGKHYSPHFLRDED